MKTLSFLNTLFLIALLGCAGPQIKPALDRIPFLGSFQVSRFQLDNRLKLLVVEDHSSPTFAYQTWYRVGSRNETPGSTGLAHLFEHMMFKGTKNYPEGEFDKILESAGAEGENAFTSRDYTVYIQELPKDKLELIVQLESDRMVNLIVNDQSFKTETEVVQNERRYRNENNPDGLMYQELFGIAFTQHPYHWPVIGYQEDLAQMSSSDALRFYQSYYSPNHATIVVVGDVVPTNVRDLVERYYGKIPKHDSPTHLVMDEPKQTSSRRKKLSLNIQVEKLLMGYHIPEFTHPDTPALAVAQSILTAGKSSRLHRALVETGIASSVESYELEDKDPSLLIISANLQKKNRASQAEFVIKRELAHLIKEPVSSKELERAKNKLNFMFYESLSSNSKKANLLGHYETIANDFTGGLEVYKKIQSIGPGDIQRVIQQYLTPENHSVIFGVPK